MWQPEPAEHAAIKTDHGADPIAGEGQDEEAASVADAAGGSTQLVLQPDDGYRLDDAGPYKSELQSDRVIRVTWLYSRGGRIQELKTSVYLSPTRGFAAAQAIWMCAAFRAATCSSYRRCLSTIVSVENWRLEDQQRSPQDLRRKPLRAVDSPLPRLQLTERRSPS